MPLEESPRNFLLLVSGPFHSRHEALQESFYSEAQYREFLAKRLPHLETMSPSQHALATLINAACYVREKDSKRLLCDVLLQQLGFKVLP